MSSQKSLTVIFPPLFEDDEKNVNYLTEMVYEYAKECMNSKINHVIFISDKESLVEKWGQKFDLYNNRVLDYQWSWMSDKDIGYYLPANNKLIEKAFIQGSESVDLPSKDGSRIIFVEKIKQGFVGLEVDKNNIKCLSVFRENKEKNLSIFLNGTCAQCLDNGKKALDDLIKRLNTKQEK